VRTGSSEQRDSSFDQQLSIVLPCNQHTRRLISGLMYILSGCASTDIFVFMTYVVIPLSALKRPFSMSFFLGQLVTNMVFVGVPIALIVKHFS
jgi:hypothetical protein